MADFTAQLTAPQGAGTQPIAPVQEQVSRLGVSPVFEGIVDVFAKGLAADKKDQLLQQKNNVINSYSREIGTINDAVMAGTMDAAQASIRTRSITSKYLAANGQFAGDIQGVYDAYKGSTVTGTNLDAEKTEQKRHEDDVSAAKTMGFSFPPGMTKEQEQRLISIASQERASAYQFSEQVKRSSEARAQSAEQRAMTAEGRAATQFQNALDDRMLQENSLKMVNDIAGGRLEAFSLLGSTLGANVRSGRMTQEAAASQLAQQFSTIQAAIQAAAGKNPELAAPYRSLFNDMNATAQALIDPNKFKESDQLAEQLARIQNQYKLIAMNDPKLAPAIIGSQLLPNNPYFQIETAKTGPSLLARLSQVNVNSGTAGEVQVVGIPENEAALLPLLKGGLQNLTAGRVQNKELAAVQGSNSVNAILKQTGDFLTKEGASPAQLKGVAEFFASPEYAGFVTSGRLDPQAAGTAKKAFQILYEPTIVKGIEDKLKGPMVDYQSAAATASEYGSSEFANKSNKPLGQSVNIRFTGSGVVFEAKEVGADAAERRAQRDAVNSLNTAQKGLNQLIRIGAHMEGTTDYQTYWENNKHVLVPSMFSRYSNIEIGAVKNGYRFNGGNANDKSSWTKVN